MISKRISAFLCGMPLACCAAVVFGASPGTIGYQGYLTDGSGAPVTAPAKTIGFALYSTATGSAPLWSESQDVRVGNGVYNVLLGSVHQIDLPFDSPYFLGITIPPGGELSPRQALTNTPYAFRAKMTDGVALPCQDGGVLIYKSGYWQCGAVTTLPNAAATCVGTDCTISMCTPGYGNCNNLVPDGCEVDLKTSFSHCGACGNVCTPPAHMASECTAGTCTPNGCIAGWGDCNKDQADGCETNTTIDVLNCGACGNTCSLIHAVTACANSACVISACETGWGNCDFMNSNGCEVSLTNDPMNCGSCGNVCPSGNCTNSVCIPKLSGAACIANNQCASGFCTDGVCCQNACNGTCERCNLAGQAGICSPIPAGQDPDNECITQSPDSCGTTGVCSGSRSCAYYPVGTTAVPESCTGETHSFSATCNGTGSFSGGGSVSCAPYTCGTTSCKTSCTDSRDCAGGFTCNGFTCI